MGQGGGGEGGEEARAHLLRTHVEAPVLTLDDKICVLVLPPATAPQRHTARQAANSANGQQAVTRRRGFEAGLRLTFTFTLPIMMSPSRGSREGGVPSRDSISALLSALRQLAQST